MNKNTENPLRMMGLIGTLGSEIVIMILIGVWLGKWLDQTFSTEPVWLLVGVLGGLITGIVGAAMTLKAFIKE
ncbi:AtpZ/AtpI family protein [Mechercharimyces sp. CAU 1602]|uniref:AtpZ/AtpI family protein n=1 Tax=Mechercharimyces sp. CAU 1602 TaxID=2973933 RepID=UPI0021613935|nr:AtpZ/AtpI family protein [Mechercharimyces sp. CAU 1602]MCS1352288.1 AtpZ/AtpI family protein [Mechercharimyces sp. CAU 1602]